MHECGHFHLKHFYPDETSDPFLREMYTGNQKETYAEQEWECEKWTIETLRKEGLVVSQEVIGNMRLYVAECIDEDTLKKKSPKYVRRWIR